MNMARKWHRQVTMLLIVFTFTLLLSGCGTSSSDNSSAPTEPTATAGAGIPENPAQEMTEAPDVASSEATDPTPSEKTDPETTVFNSETLAAYDGKEGNPAYVAINGVVYDVTDVPNWRNGLHNGNTAGMDLTPALGKSPHGEKVLADLPVVGTYE